LFCISDGHFTERHMGFRWVKILLVVFSAGMVSIFYQLGTVNVNELFNSF
jgi:hypothetical protein